LQYVGKTGEVTFSSGVENVEWWDNSGATQTLYALDIDKINPSFTFSFLQVTDQNILTLALNADMDNTGSTNYYGFLGSNPDAYTEGEWRLVGESVDGRSLTLVVRRGILFSSGDITLGAAGSYSNVPVTLRVLQDTTITDTKRDMIYWILQKRSFS